MEAVKKSPFAQTALCEVSQGQDCVVENVKVYCGANSRKRSVGDQRIITFDFVISDKNASSDPKEEATKYVSMLRLRVSQSDKGFLKFKVLTSV